MSDEKEDAGIDFEDKLAKIINQKSRKRNNNDIYERFINRVHGSEENDQPNFKTLEGSKNLAAFEPLSTEELQLFEDQSSEQELLLETEDTTPTNTISQASDANVLSENELLNTDNDSDSSGVNDVSLNTENLEYIDSNNETALSSTDDYSESTNIMSDDEPLHTEDLSNSVTEAPVIKEVIKRKKPITKPVVIAMAIGLVILVTIILALLFSGILSTSTVDNTDNNAETNVAIESTPPVSVEPALSTDNQPNTNDTDSATVQSASPIQQNGSDGNKQDMPAINESEPAFQSSTPEDGDSIIATEEAAITYEDFRQESQTTIYRETND